MSDDKRTVFCFGVDGWRDDEHDNCHPASLYVEDVKEPYDYYTSEESDRMIRSAFDALPNPPDTYEQSDAGPGGWVRFDYHKLVEGKRTEPFEVSYYG